MSCMSVLAFTLVNLGIVACLIAFCAPFWVVDNSILVGVGDATKNVLSGLGIGVSVPKSKHEGLWGVCTHDMLCTGVWENEFSLEKGFPAWKKASQGLYAGGVVLLLVSIFISSLHVCCSMCKASYSIKSALGSLTLAGVLCIAASLAIYGGFMYKEGHLEGSKDLNWGYWCGVGGVAACFLSSFFYFLDSCCGGRHEGYHMTRVV